MLLAIAQTSLAALAALAVVAFVGMLIVIRTWRSRIEGATTAGHGYPSDHPAVVRFRRASHNAGVAAYPMLGTFGVAVGLLIIISIVRAVVA